MLSWQQLTLQSTADDWSDEYRVDSPRLLLPLTRCFECRIGATRFTCDPSTALRLTPTHTYHMRRSWAAQRSALLVLETDLGSPRRSSLPLAARLCLSLWASEWAAGSLELLALEERIVALVQHTLAVDCSAPDRPHRAVEHAREYLASAPERNDTLAEIARAVHCSPFHLARTFRRHAGRPCMRFLSVALHLLHSGFLRTIPRGLALAFGSWLSLLS